MAKCQQLRPFTFQYVSINTFSAGIKGRCREYLHSNMFLLIHSPRRGGSGGKNNLHSNMFLLIQWNDERTGVHKTHLHSNMFLLILTLMLPAKVT